MEMLKNIFILALLIILVRKRIQLGHAFLLSACLFGILHQLSFIEMGKIAYSSFLSPSTLTILGSLFLINIMENIVCLTGSQTRLVSSIKSFTGDPRFAMVALPALIGLLPSPGGARFSAPMVKEASLELKVTPEQNAAINYYFRHIWEFFLPLYPANLLAAGIIKIPISKFLLMMFPFTLATLLIGLILFRKIPVVTKEKEETKAPPKVWSHLCEGLLPIILIILLVITFKMSILLALVIIIITMLFYYRINLAKFLVIIKDALTPGLFYMTFSAIYLSDVLEQSGSIEHLLTSFLQGGLSPLLITIFFPFLIGLFTGITIPGITIALPIIMNLAGPNELLSLSCLAFMSNFIGVMLSPMHLCLLMSIEYFSANFTQTYRYLYLPETFLLIFSILYSYCFL